MKRFKQRRTGLAMALGLFAAMANAGDVVSSAAGGWFAVDARDVKDTTWEGGVIVAGETNLVLQCSPNAWGAADGGSGVTVAYRNATTGDAGTIAKNTTAESVDWTPNTYGTFVLTHTVANGGDPVVLTTQFIAPSQVGDDAWAYVSDGTCTITGTGATWAKSEWTDGNPLADVKTDIRNVVVADGVTGIGAWSFAKCYALTNVSCAASVISVGEGAFSRCLGIERLAFAGEQANVSLGAKAVTIRPGIRMEGSEPVVWPIPTVTYGGAEPTLYGKEKLTDATWTEVTDANKATFHFFTYEP